MTSLKTIALLAVTALLAVAGTATAADIPVSGDIVGSVTWTANNTYDLQDQVYVKPGATLTIEAGTVVASTPTENGAGSLAVCQGGQIFIQGTADNPVIMTSKNDVATWVGGDPKTGTWREAANEWGNLTVMGRALISNSYVAGNQPYPANNISPMEGLVPDFTGDPDTIYGGIDDNDDSGTIAYLSLRYGGRVVGLANELNGMSLGGIGRATDIHHVEIMNNVDDGIEIWGGTVCTKYVSIWNIGDDSFDIDQGHRGMHQFGLIVQGYSLDASQGSGVGDNCCETDGAEDSDAQPVTTTALWNFTVIGQPLDGDGATAWRDNARVQYNNCIFMDCGEKVVRFDNVDGDGAQGYGHNGTLDWPTTWTTPYTATSTVNESPSWTPGSYDDPSVLYQAQQFGNLIHFRGCVFQGNYHGSAYTEANARGVFDPANQNILEPVNLPIQGLTRGTPVLKGGKNMWPVTSLNPCAANDALTPGVPVPADAPCPLYNVPFRGAFSANTNWLAGWAASDAFGMVDTSMNQPAPPADEEVLLVSLSTELEFDTDAGVVYTVEKSSDMTNWTPVGTVIGNGGTMSVADVDEVADAQFYRVIRQ